jgi:hypothetical protein
LTLDMYGSGGAVKPGKYGARKKPPAPGGLLGIADYALETCIDGKGYEVTKNDGQTMQVNVDWQTPEGFIVKGSFAGVLAASVRDQPGRARVAAQPATTAGRGRANGGGYAAKRRRVAS